MKKYNDIIMKELSKKGIKCQMIDMTCISVADYVEELGVQVVFLISANEINETSIQLIIQTMGICKINNHSKVLDKLNEINRENFYVNYGLSEHDNLFCKVSLLSRGEYVVDDSISSIGMILSSLIDFYPEIMKANWS